MFENIAQALTQLNQRIDEATYLFSGRWITDRWRGAYNEIKTGQLDEYFLAGTILLIWLIMLGARWPQRYIFWGWVVFWAVRGFTWI